MTPTPRVLRYLSILACALPFLASPLGGTVRINEFMASNGTTLADEDGDFEDWIELYNFGDAAVALEGWGLSDNENQVFKWRFPAGVVLAPGEFLLVWASGKDRGAGNDSGVEPLAPEAAEGLVLRLRAEDIATANGETVGVWPDTSGRQNHAVQPDVSRRPVFVAAGLNGRAALRFNRAAAQQLFLPSSNFDGMADFGDFTFLTVARWTGGVRSGFFGGYRGANTANAGSAIIEVSDTGGAFRLRLPLGIDMTASNAFSLNTWHIAGAAMDGAKARARLTCDGVLLAEASGSLGQTLLAEYERVPLGSSHDDGRTFGGEIAEVLLYNRSLSMEEQGRVEAYLKNDYGIYEASLHPHTNFRISAQGEELLLTRPDGTLADYVEPVAVPRDLSYGRRVDDPTLWAYYYEPTPGAANTTPPFASLIGPAGLSHDAGVYHAAFDLVLTHPDPDVTILYTLDGSEPVINNLGGTTYNYLNSYPSGPLLQNSFATVAYTQPIRVGDRSSEPDKLVRISGTADSSPSYFPVGPVKKATVVRARAYRDSAMGPVSTATYFVSNTGSFDYDMPVVSLSVDEDGLFDFFEGIYVAGADHVSRTGGRICNWGNYNRRGREAERSAHIEFFDSGSRFLEQTGGVRIQGNCSRMLPFKSLRLYARNVDLDEGVFDFSFFPRSVPGATQPGNTRYQRLILRTPNFYDTAFSRLFQGVYEGVAGRLQPVKQFINGEYWGLAMMRDRFDPYHLQHHYGLDPDNIVIIGIRYRHELEPVGFSFHNRVYDVSSGFPEDMTTFEAMRTFITGSNMADPDQYAEAAQWICLDSFIDHLILKIFAGDDHYAPEIIYWRVRETEGEGFGDGRWRFFVKDFDSTLHMGNYVTGLATGTHPRPFGYELFASFLESPDFRTRFINRFADLLNTHFLTERFRRIIDETYDEVAPVWGEVATRWRNAPLTNPNHPFTTAKRADLRDWAEQHPARQRSHLRSHFSLAPERPLTVRVADAAQGRVRVNSFVIDPETPGVSSPAYPWTGRYFPGHPVKLVALPVEGYRLREWRITPAAGGETSVLSTPEILLSVDEALTAEAFFAPLPPVLPDFIEVIAGAPVAFDLEGWFPGLDPDAEISVNSTEEAVLAASVSGRDLLLTPTSAGESSVTVAVIDEDYGFEEHTFRVLVYGLAFSVAGGTYRFESWSAGEPAGRYPPNMLFTQSDVTDPGLLEPLLVAYRIPPEDAANAIDVEYPYAASSRTRINGLGDDGIRFINTGRGRDLGAAVLSLDTRGANDIRVVWTAGTDLPNSRVYALRLQYRIGLDSGWADVRGEDGLPFVYFRNGVAGHSQTFGPVVLPVDAEGAPLVQLRWKYYHVAGSSGPRAALRLDDIVVATGAANRFADWLHFEVLDPVLRSDPDYTGPEADPANSGIPNLLRYALGVGWMEPPRERMPVLRVHGEVVIFRFPFDPDLADITYRVLASEDLKSWANILFDSRVHSLFEGTEGWLEIPVEVGPGRFFRLEVIADSD